MNSSTSPGSTRPRQQHRLPPWSWNDGFGRVLLRSRRKDGAGEARWLADREADVFLELVAAAAIAVALLTPQSPAAPLISGFLPLAALAVLTPIFGLHVWKGLGLRRIGLSYWPVALLVPVAVAAACTVVSRALGADASVADLDPTRGSVIVALVLTTTVVVGEEIGWRGFLLPRLQRLTVPAGGAVLTGLAHGLVNLPPVIVIMIYTGTSSQWMVAPLTVVTITAAGVFYAWLRDAATSLWPAVIAHATANLTLILLAGSTDPAGSEPVAQLGGGVGIAAAAIWSCVAVGVLLIGRRGVWRSIITDH